MNVSTYTHESYDGGLNDTASAQNIKRNEASILRNWDITYDGQLVRRDGLTLVGSSLGSSPITGIGAYIRNGGKDILATYTTSLYYLNGSTWTQLDSGFTNTSGLGFAMENVQSLGKIFIGNEDNYIHSWDRVATTLNSCLTDLGADVPHGNVLRWHKNHMFTINNVNVSGTKYPNRIYWSDLGDPTAWTEATSYFEVPGAGRAITMIDLGNSLVIFKERAIQFLEGWGSTSWAVTASASNVSNIDEQVGIAGIHACCRVGNEVWFVDDEGQIRRLYQTDFDAFRKDIISTKIQGTLAGINKTQLSKCVAFSHNDKVYFAFPNGSDTNNSLVCVYDIIASKRSGEEAWTTYTGWTPGIFADYPTSTTPVLYIGDATIGKIYTHTGPSDNGVAIDANWTGRDDDYDARDRTKRYRWGEVTGSSGAGDVNVELYASVDLSPFANVGTLELLATGSKLGPTGSFLLGPTGNATLGGGGRASERFLYTNGGGSARGKTVRHSIRHNVLSEQPTIDTYSSHFRKRDAR